MFNQTGENIFIPHSMSPKIQLFRRMLQCCFLWSSHTLLSHILLSHQEEDHRFENRIIRLLLLHKVS